MGQVRHILIAYLLFCISNNLYAANLSVKEALGKILFFDKNLSLNGNQACGDCHVPEVGWTGNDPVINAGGAAYEGSITGRFSNRKPPTAAYATPSPTLHFVMADNDALFIGGNFWNGRATGERLGNPAAEQAQGPFLNPVEQALSDSACVVYKVCSTYPEIFEKSWPDSCKIQWPTNANTLCVTEGGKLILSDKLRAKTNNAYDYIALSIAAYEASAEVNQYTSKYDYYLAGLVELNREEQRGLDLFKGKAECAECHVLDNGPNGEPPLFTDFTFDNLGVPRNPDNPWYKMPARFNPDGIKWLDQGLGEFLATRSDYRQFAEKNYGKQKVPTLRNVDKRPHKSFVKAYMHNGYFKSLKTVVHFYNTRDTKPKCKNPFTNEADALTQNCWPEAQITTNINRDELGDLGLTDTEENALVTFMQTLSDGFEPPPSVKRLTPGIR
jgi:cytochrome c peroxidase